VKVAVISCWNYRDCWQPFRALFDQFWPDHPPITLITDRAGKVGGYGDVFQYESLSWCAILKAFADQCSEPILLFLDDFFLSAPVQTELVEHGERILQEERAGCVRLYPCPGGDEDYGDSHFRRVSQFAPYRISTQPAIWDPTYLSKIASRFNSPWEFETAGTLYSRELEQPVFAFDRDVKPWPLEILCTAIVRGEWSHGAKTLCDAHQIPVDWSQRPFQLA
jgi:hypothetical protein